ncbi:MAG: hypothetical protein ACOX9R_03920 [Armatimonadota bacterium]
MIAVSGMAVDACPTGLNVVPTADVQPEGRLSIQLEVARDATAHDDDPRWSLLAQIGLPHRTELGVDLADLQSDALWLLDAKWQVVEESDDHPAVALGLLDINRGPERGYYLAGARHIGSGALRAHAGVLRVNDTTAGMFGAEVEVAPRTVMMIDLITGADGRSGLGVEHALGAGYGVYVFHIAGNTDDGAHPSGLNLSWEGRW